MARYARISAVAPRPYEINTKHDLSTCVDEMIAHWDEWLDKVMYNKPDLIVLPEACDRPPNFPMELRKAYYEARGNRIRDHFMEVAKANNCNIAYSAARLLPDGTYRNSTQFLNRKGGIDGIYNKNHLVTTEYTEGGILYGKDTPLIQMDFGTVGGVICFDLNFAELRLKYASIQPELIVFSSMYHGGLMQNYWAYSCHSYFIGAIPGDQCTIINPLGDLIAQSTNYYPYVTADVNLDFKMVHLDGNWNKLDEARKKYGKKVQVYDPGHIGVVLLTSESDEISSKDIIEEFEMELWDDYYARSLAARNIPGRLEP
jgi:hypothetical protein